MNKTFLQHLWENNFNDLSKEQWEEIGRKNGWTLSKPKPIFVPVKDKKPLAYGVPEKYMLSRSLFQKIEGSDRIYYIYPLIGMRDFSNKIASSYEKDSIYVLVASKNEKGKISNHTATAFPDVSLSDRKISANQAEKELFNLLPVVYEKIENHYKSTDPNEKGRFKDQ